MSLQVTWHSRANAIPADLWERFFRVPFEGQFWYRSIEMGCLDPCEYNYGLLHRGSKVVGLMPAFVFEMPIDLILPPASRQALKRSFARLCGIRKLRIFFVGSVGGEEGHVGLDASLSLRNVALQLHDAARARATLVGARFLVWKDFTTNDAVALDDLCVLRRAFRIPSFPGSEIQLVQGGYESFLRTQTAARRYKIKRKFSIGKSVLPTQTRLIATPTPADVNRLFKLFQQTYERGAVKFESLTEAFFLQAAQAVETQFIVLETLSSREPVAFMLLLRLGERVINRFVGIDYARGTQTYLSFRLFAAAYDWAASTGARVLQSGQTGYVAKLDLGHNLVPLFNYCEHSNRLVNAVLARASRDTTWESLDRSLSAHVRANRVCRPRSRTAP